MGISCWTSISGIARLDVRPDPQRVAAVLAVHRVEPGAIGQPDRAPLQAGVRRFRTGNLDRIDRQARGRLSPRSRSAWRISSTNFPSAQIGLPVQTSRSKPRESIASMTKSSTPEASSSTARRCRACWPDARSTLVVENPSVCQPGQRFDHRRTGLQALRNLAAKGDDCRVSRLMR